MKKTYQIPTTTMLHVELQQMIASSEKVGFGEKVNTAAGAESRGVFFDDDEE